jgi:putative glutamine amidotransferase
MKIAIAVSGKEKTKGTDSAYFQAMLRAGARPEELQMVTAADAGTVSSRDFDGILFTGGEDVDPVLYEERIKYDNVHVERSRDEFEFGLLEGGLRAALPILAICRGTQMVNVKFGGTLYQDLKSDKNLERDHKQQGSRSSTTHPVTVTDPDSLLHRLIEGSCMVNSLHHQAIKRPGRGLKATAYSDDGLCEAIEVADHDPFFLGVQWHPEELVAEHPEQLRIFQEFIARCRERAAQVGEAS